MPLVIVAVVVAFVATEWLEPPGPPASHQDSQPVSTGAAAQM
jgi:hypothetical protein